jgi:hypothetical protein
MKSAALRAELDQRGLVGIGRAARQLGVSAECLYALVRARHIDAQHVEIEGQTMVAIPVDVVDELMRRTGRTAP